MKKTLVMIMTILMCVVLAACASDTPSGETGESGKNIGTFVSEDMEGNEVSEAIFGDKDVTVLNIWATFCGPCIGEMPELAALADELPDNAQVIGVVIDTQDAGNIDLAKEICSENGVKFTNILASETVLETFGFIEAVPTTFILDRSGNVVGEPIVGANVEGYKKAVEEYLAGL